MPYNLENNIAYKILESRNAHEFIADIKKVARIITPILNEICTNFGNYTLHDIGHSLRVLYNMCAIAGEEKLEKFSNLELTMIIYSALLHDVGMWLFPDEKEEIEKDVQFQFYLKKNKNDKILALQDYIRPIHGKRSYAYIMNDVELEKNFRDSHLSTVSFREDIALICQSHMENIDWIDKNLKESFCKSQHYNSKFIALLLRIADYIDFDSQRAPEYLFMHKKLGDYSCTEWQKHATICNREKVDKVSKEIYFDIECKDFHLYCKLMDTFESMNKEVYNSVSYSKKFADEKYHLQIRDKIRYRIDTNGFHPERFCLSLDYDKVTNLLMGENLYGDKRYGFRELLQNCFDACNTMKAYYSMHDSTIHYEPQVSIIYDYDNETVVIKDNGTGMSKDIINNYFLTIGKSYYRSDEYGKLGYKINPTGTFGIGFLSCFMLSRKVTISTKHYETGEISSFTLEKDSKYICYIDKTFWDTHGTIIELSMAEFEKVFSKKEMISFIDENFYELDVRVNVYQQKAGVITQVEQAKATYLTRYLDIDLSPYLEGVECKANFTTLLDEFEFYDKFLDVDKEECNVVLFDSNNIQFIPQKLYCEHYEKRCVVLHSYISFEEMIMQMYEGNPNVNINALNIDELVENFERYGFKVFDLNFNEYLVDDNRGWWINSVDSSVDRPICVLWANCLQNAYIQKIIQKTKMRYLLDVGAISKNFSSEQEELDISSSSEYTINSNTVYEDVTSKEFVLSFRTNQIISYRANVCYRGVLLSDVKLRIPYIANLLTSISITVNILSETFLPSVTRRGLTDEQEKILAYAIGRAMHLYLMGLCPNDIGITLALKSLVKSKYSICNILCKNHDIN